MFGKEKPLKGVNLGGWLVLERWITPSLFEGLRASDEYGFCQELGPQTAGRLKRHRDNFIRAEDFKWLAEQGIEAVRLPLGYWLFGGYPPFINCQDYVDFTFEQAQRNNLKVILDLHAAPGSQNGNDHSGRQGIVGWPTSENIKKSLNFIERLVLHYGKQQCLAAVQLLNEPSYTINHRLLRQFYMDGYELVRKHCPAAVAVIFADTHPRRQDWRNDFKDCKNILLDIHLYQAHSLKAKYIPFKLNLVSAKRYWPRTIKKLNRQQPVIIGEWSASPNLNKLNLVIGTREKIYKQFFQIQQAAFSQSAAWFYWTYKLENNSGLINSWSFREMVKAGLATV